MNYDVEKKIERLITLAENELFDDIVKAAKEIPGNLKNLGGAVKDMYNTAVEGKPAGGGADPETDLKPGSLPQTKISDTNKSK